MSCLNPMRWTLLTWVLVLVWCWYAIPRNIPPSLSHTIDSSTGAITKTDHYHNLAEIPFPIGWPVHYVIPVDPSKEYLLTPVLASIPVPKTGPSTISYFAMIANGILILLAVASLIFISQTYLRRFWLYGLLSIPLALVFYVGVARIIAATAGYTTVEWFTIAIYFLPIVAVFVLFAFSLWTRIPAAPSVNLTGRGITNG